MPEYSSLQKDYARYRIERAREDLDAAHLLFEAGEGVKFSVSMGKNLL